MMIDGLKKLESVHPYSPTLSLASLIVKKPASISPSLSARVTTASISRRSESRFITAFVLSPRFVALWTTEFSIIELYKFRRQGIKCASARFLGFERNSTDANLSRKASGRSRGYCRPCPKRVPIGSKPRSNHPIWSCHLLRL
jgi:hypothetical protein